MDDEKDHLPSETWEAALGWRAAYRNPDSPERAAFVPVWFWGRDANSWVALVMDHESDALVRASAYNHPALGDFITVLAPGEDEEEAHNPAQRLHDEENAADVHATNCRIVAAIQEGFATTVSMREAQLAHEFFGGYVDGLTTMPADVFFAWLKAHRWVHKPGV